MIKLATVLDEHELAVLANLDQSDFWRIVAKIVSCELKAVNHDIRVAPKFCDEDLTEDLRYKMGGSDRLNWVLELPQEARALLKQR